MEASVCLFLVFVSVLLDLEEIAVKHEPARHSSMVLTVPSRVHVRKRIPFLVIPGLESVSANLVGQEQLVLGPAQRTPLEKVAVKYVGVKTVHTVIQ